MAQEQHSLGCGYSGGVSNCRSKKNKQKKAPQRGLGVAQLEKIILEEQQKKDFLVSHSDIDTPPFLALPNFRPSLCPSVSNIEIRNENFVPISNAGGGGEVVSEAGLSPRHENWPKSWSGEYAIEDMMSTEFEPQVKLTYESNAPILAQRSHQFQRPPLSCSSLVKSSSGISTVINTHMELPSIQSFQFKNYAFTEDDKMIGMKRPYPFSLESPQTSYLQCNFHPSHAISLSKSDELASFTNEQYTLHMEPRNKLIRECISNASPPERNPNGLSSDNERLNGDFLTLAPPAVASPPLKSMHKHTLDYSGQCRHGLSENECIPGQEYGKSQIHRPGPSGSLENSFSFFPFKLRTYQTTAYVSSSDGKKGETIDLNLKL